MCTVNGQKYNKLNEKVKKTQSCYKEYSFTLKLYIFKNNIYIFILVTDTWIVEAWFIFNLCIPINGVYPQC